MIHFRKITYIISGFLVLLSISAIAIWGFNLGIDFKGGSLLEIEYSEARPDASQIKEALKDFQIGELRIQPTGDKGFLLRFKEIDETTHQRILKGLVQSDRASEKRFDSIGPILGKELQKRALIAISLAVLMIISYIGWAFRKVSRPISSWKYGIVAIVALLHDVLIPSGVFSALGYLKGVEIDALFVTALLTILGFSVHDTIVVFDRVRENLKKNPGVNFEMTVDKSVRETIARSINTSLTVLFVLFALLFFGGETTRFFSLALIIGIFFGTYSSIFLASPLLVSWNNWSQKRKNKFKI